jgi:transcriptional regulator with XRE-family HTH domain
MMKKKRKTYGKTYIRDWRRAQKMTLEKLVEELHEKAGFETTAATLSRVEQSLQPYSQPLLEAIARTLFTTPASLLTHPPGDDSDIYFVWSQLSPEKRRTAFRIMQVLKETYA